jgi:hypothetical protein
VKHHRWKRPRGGLLRDHPFPSNVSSGSRSESIYASEIAQKPFRIVAYQSQISWRFNAYGKGKLAYHIFNAAFLTNQLKSKYTYLRFLNSYSEYFLKLINFKKSCKKSYKKAYKFCHAMLRQTNPRYRLHSSSIEDISLLFVLGVITVSIKPKLLCHESTTRQPDSVTKSA